jgi:hypothetical protein
MTGNELRARIKRLGITYAEAAERLGLGLGGLNKQMRGDTKVSRQTAMLLVGLERGISNKTRAARRGFRLPHVC